MFFPVDEPIRRRARAAHELAMVNLIGLNLLLGVLLLAGAMAEPDSTLAAVRWYAAAVPLVLSLGVIGLTRWRAARAAGREPWFVAVHWGLAARRYRVLLAAWLLTAAVLSLGLLGNGADPAFERRIATLPPALQEMERHKHADEHLGEAIWGRIGVVPLLLAVMALIMLESGALYQAGRGEVPDALLARWPPPPDLPGSATPVTPG